MVARLTGHMFVRLFPSAVILVLFSAGLSGCFTPPAPSAGTFPPVGISETQHGGQSRQRVRWVGTIISTNPAKGETCFEILALPLSSEARPPRTDESAGRFIACAHGFYDPGVYARGQDLTVVGTLQQPEVRTIGQHEYVYPKIAAETVYLWPTHRGSHVYYYSPWSDPYWYPGWGPWDYSPLWGPWPYDAW